MTTIERLDIDRLHREITESAKHADGVRYPSESETQKTIEIIQKCWEGFHGQPPQQGELVRIEGEVHRIAHVWDRSEDGVTNFQPAKNGSVYLCEGFGSFSGGYDLPVKLRLSHVGWELAPFWLFYGGWSGARRGVHFTIPTRVFEEIHQE